MLYNSFTKKWDISKAASVWKLVFKPNMHVVTLQKRRLYTYILSLIHTIRTLNYWILDKFTIWKAVNAGLSGCLFVLGQGLLNRWTSQLDLGCTTGGLERVVSVHNST